MNALIRREKRNELLHIFLALAITLSLAIFVNNLGRTSITGLDFGVQADVSVCGLINQPATLTANVFSTGICFNITNSSLVFNCQGFNVTGSFAADAVTKAITGFNITNGSRNITIINCNIFNFSYGVWINRSVNQTFVINSNITNNTWGVYVDGGAAHNITHNNISYNNIGIEMRAGENITIDGNWISQNNQTGLLSRSLVKILNITNNTIFSQAIPTTPDSGVGTQSLRILSSRDVLIRDSTIENYSIQDVNITVWDTNEGKAEFFGFLSVDGLNFSKDINISHNRIYVNASTRMGGVGWNVSSGIVFYNLSSSTPLLPLVNLTDNPAATDFVICPGTGTLDDVTCTNIIDLDENYSYDVTHFSVFSTNELRVTNCPIYINVTTLLRRNVNGTSITAGQACISINNNSLVLNCTAFNVTGGGVGIGVNITNATNVTIKNCNILNFTIGINVSTSRTIFLFNNNITNLSEGIWLNNTASSALENNTINATGGRGVYLANSSNNTIKTSVLESAGNYGFNLNSGTDNSFPNNTFKGSVSAFVQAGGNNNFTDSVLVGDTAFEINSSTNIVVTNASFQNTNWSIKANIGANVSLIDNERMTNYSFNSTPRLAIRKTGIGEVTFFSIINANGTNFSMDVNLTTNRTFVNTTKSAGLNVTANITFFGLTFTTPQIIVDYKDDGAFEPCGAKCTSLSYSGGTLLFNATHFTTYSANETPLQPSPTPSPGGGSSSSRRTQITILPPPPLPKIVTPVSIAQTISISMLAPTAPSTVAAQNMQSLTAPSLSLFNSLSEASTRGTKITCGYITSQKTKGEITAQEEEFVFQLPQGYKLVTKPFALSCEGDELDLTLSVPENYTDIYALRCDNNECAKITETSASPELTCGGYTIEKIRESQIKEKPSTIKLSAFNISFEQQILVKQNQTRINISKNIVAFTGYTPKNLTAKIYSTKKLLPNFLNSELSIIGTPLTVKLEPSEKAKIPATIQLEFPNLQIIDKKSITINLLKNNGWERIDSQTNEKDNTTIISTEDLQSLLGENNEATFALSAISCTACTEAKLTKVYDGGSRNAVILVHGLLSSPATWQEVIDDYVLNKQAFQLWAFAYPSTQPTQKTAQELQNLLELHAGEYDSAFVVAHSLGGFVVQKALSNLKPEVEGKIKKVVLIASPNDGTPAISVYKNFYEYLSQSRTLQGIFDVNSEVLNELAKGVSLPPKEQVKYYVIAGTEPYYFNKRFFTQPNDGITTTFGAQHLGGNYINNTCNNYYPLNLTHTELIYQALARRVIERIIAEELPKDNTVGYNQYIRLRIKDCRRGEKIVVAGKEIPSNAAKAPLNCACGNGVCGVDETAINCPSDCAPAIKTKESVCLGLSLGIPFVIIILLVLLLAYSVLKYAVNKKEHNINKTLIYTFFSLLLIATIFQNINCKDASTLPYFVLLVTSTLILLDLIFTRKPATNATIDSSKFFSAAYDAYFKIAQWRNEIENAQNLTQNLKAVILDDLEKTKKELKQARKELKLAQRTAENKADLQTLQKYDAQLLEYIKQAKKKLNSAKL